jgi:hypothetical protein
MGEIVRSGSARDFLREKGYFCVNRPFEHTLSGPGFSVFFMPRCSACVIWTAAFRSNEHDSNRLECPRACSTRHHQSSRLQPPPPPPCLRCCCALPSPCSSSAAAELHLLSSYAPIHRRRSPCPGSAASALRPRSSPTRSSPQV